MTPDRDRQMAELSLYMDPKERANLLVEHERWERRRRAMKRGDEGSPVIPGSDCECGPLTFAPISCTSCGIKLTRQNHGNARQCETCFSETQALIAYEQKRQAYLASKAGRTALWTVLPWVAGVLGGLLLLKWWLS